MKIRRDIFQAIADPTRRAIILLLATGSLTPNVMAEHFDISRQAVSKHLQILAECDVIEQNAAGREIVYNIKRDKMKEIEQWLEQFKILMDRRFEQLDTILNVMKEKKQSNSNNK